MSQYTFGAISSAIVDVSLAQYFSWAGANFPYNSGTADIVISGPTTWADAVGYKKVKKLTINAGQTLVINKSPFYIFADEINFGDASSTIDASGLTLTSSILPSASGMAKGGYSTAGYSAAGCGGGMLFIICNRITGANGAIKANGGNPYTGTASATKKGGQGALSSTINGASGTSELFNYLLGGNSLTYNGATAISALSPSTVNLLGKGGNYTTGIAAVGGGSGLVDTTSTSPNGGSGIGGGGGGSGAGSPGLPASVPPSILDLLSLANLKCLGGGGGGVSTSNSDIGGGGGGSLVVWVHVLTATPTLQANGGPGSGANNNGGAGVTYLITL